MSDELMDAPVDSSTTTESVESTDPSQATTQPAPVAQPKGFHEHPDWQRMVASRREDRAQLAQLQRELQEFKQRQQQPSSPDGPLTGEEQAAIQALKKLMARDPELATALMAGKQLPQFQQRFQGIDQMQQQAARAHINAAKSTIKEMAAADNLSTDEANLKHIVRLVSGAAMEIENGEERFRSGDMGILQEAYDAVKPFLSALRKPAEVTLTQTKNKMKGLPPPPRGGTPGPAAPKPIEPGKEREFESDMHSRAKSLLESLKG